MTLSRYLTGGKMTERAYAKLNLILDVKNKRNDGYHELKSLMIPIDFYDTLTFEAYIDIKLTSNVDIIDNSIIKVAKHMKEYFGVETGVHIHLDKVIPIGAGLAGGSADISATIRGLNSLWQLNLSSQTLETLANKFGSDTLFTLYNRPAIIFGRGDEIMFIEETEKLSNLLLIIPNFSMLTKDVFKAFVKKEPNNFDSAYEGYKNKDYKYLYNDLLDPSMASCPEFRILYTKLKADGINVYLSGSGSTLFMVEPNELDLKKLSNYDDIQMIHTKQR